MKKNPCSDCRKNQACLISLDSVKPGGKLTIKAYPGCAKATMRLMNMGLRIGDQVEVITNSGKGQMIIAVDYNRFVLGRGMAHKIMVEQIRSEDKIAICLNSN